ncbi:hypothetical protein Acr_00g0064080 [Actinidia rufa]|uniref:Retrovirus-related Pol polyprotein from transposon TNT 1-94-like beta-barrel domain-containing protein n=1 Tax=Actinidia rufa TaxID=165716 RepID=A0A7J0DPY3_9ERIC|nr:hypothetical protein Acr_00g0064080 [Actinidia rufa]
MLHNYSKRYWKLYNEIEECLEELVWLEDDVRQVERATGSSSWGDDSFKKRRESMVDHEDRLVQTGHLKEYVDRKKIKEEEAEVRPNPRGLNHSNLENRIQGEIHIIRQMHEVFSVQLTMKKPTQGLFELGSIIFTNADLKRVQHPHSDPLVIQLWVHNYEIKRILVDTSNSFEYEGSCIHAAPSHQINLRHHLCKKSSGLREHLVFLFSKCAYAPTMESFHKLLDQFIREEGPIVTELLKDLPYTHWCNAYFRGQSIPNSTLPSLTTHSSQYSYLNYTHLGYHNRQTAAVTDSSGLSPDSSSSTLTAADVETIVTQVVSRTNLHSSALSTTSGTLPWLFDTACCNHMTSDTSLFSITHPTSSIHPIHTADGSLMTTTHTGTISTPDLTIDHTYLVPALSHNLLSVGQLCELGFHLHFSNSSCFVQDPRMGKTIGTGRKVGRLFELESLHAPHRSVAAAASSSSSPISFERKLRHILDTVRALLISASVIESFWGEAALTTVYTINRTPSLVTDNISPYEKLYSTTPNYNLLRGTVLNIRDIIVMILSPNVFAFLAMLNFGKMLSFSVISKTPTPSGLGRPLFTDPTLDIILPVTSPSSAGSPPSPNLPSRIMDVPDVSPPAAPPSVPCPPIRSSTRVRTAPSQSNTWT